MTFGARSIIYDCIQVHNLNPKGPKSKLGFFLRFRVGLYSVNYFCDFLKKKLKLFLKVQECTSFVGI
jgi:hypothetical protein